MSRKKKTGSYWLDQRDIPDSKFGKTKHVGCVCDYGFTCRACLEYAATRNMREQEHFKQR